MNIGWPQLIVVVLAAMTVAISTVKHGEYRPPYSAWGSFIGIAIELALLYWGGFFS